MKKRLELFALIAISALAASFLFLNPGFLNTRGGGDSPFLFFRLHQLYSALTQGVFPVRWMPDAAYGLGYPFFNYYAALPLYLAAFFKLLGASYVLTLKLTHLAGFLLAAFAMYGWLRSTGASRLAAWAAAAAYTFAPFHLVNVYVRGDSLNEFFAFALYPLCLWSVQRINNQLPITNNKLSAVGYWSLPLALSYAALVLTHNISALIFSPFLGLYILFLLFAPQPNQQQGESRLSFDAPRKALFIVHCSLSITLGLALSAFFWVPALREANFGQLAPVTSGYFHYTNHFRGLDLVQPSLLFNYDTAASGSSPFAMGLAQTLAAALAILVVAVRFVARLRHPHSSFIIHHSSFVIFSLLLSTFMITPLSQPLWDRLPLLPFVQFPWRFLSVQSLFASALLAFAFTPPAASEDPTETKTPSRLSFDVSLAILLSAFSILPTILPLRPDFIPLTDSDITPERLQTYEYFTGNIGTTINYEYLPKWTQPRPYSSEEFIFGDVSLKVLSGEAVGERASKRAASQTWRVTVESDSASLAVPLLYWPGWEARSNGQPVELRPADGLGWIAFDLPRGEHTLELRLGDTETRRNAVLVSMIASLIVVILAQPWRLLPRLFAFFAPLRLRIIGLASLITLVVVTIAGRIINHRQQSVGAATMDFDQQGYLHSSAVTFGNGDVLLGYNYSTETLVPGDPLGLAFHWQADHNAVFNIDLVSPAEHLLHLPATFATVSGIAENQAALTLPIPPDLSTGVYLLRLSLVQDGILLAPAFTSNNQPRGALYLRPIRIIRPDDPATRPPDSALTLTPALGLTHIIATQTDPATLSLRLNWQTIAPVPANYTLALRLRDDTGFDLAALDVQPTLGLYPTSAWRRGEIIPDAYQFGLPSGLPPGDYPLTITLYDPATLAAAATLTTPIRLSQWSPPPGTDPLHRFTDTLALHDVTLPLTARAGDRVTFTARWTSLAALTQDLAARWSAVNRNGEIVAFEDQPLAIIPTSQWAAGALVLSRPSIKLPLAAEPGEHTLNVQLLDPAGELLSPPLAVGAVIVTPSDRTAQLPEMQFETNVSLGPLTLAGYDVELTAENITLTFYSQAGETMDADYKYFVHLFNPADETIAAQSDGFPSIPTSQWEPGEVVSVTVSLPVADLSPETVYNLGVGWYDPNTGDRLGDRIILSQGVVKP